ncbi:hypothetical protein M7I_5030 [Glarea lozoyensis 74030]|uniref:Uncharacterized protein n=1 Tax=Glarea lozoyensis (strain ATCC 74030 / MF5533) TaxID=1104152 RepID=H0EQS5_GLAL7|nr:hypothetical protein M7I_5030 [Glarea lozoyensis 74030]
MRGKVRAATKKAAKKAAKNVVKGLKAVVEFMGSAPIVVGGVVDHVAPGQPRAAAPAAAGGGPAPVPVDGGSAPVGGAAAGMYTQQQMAPAQLSELYNPYQPAAAGPAPVRAAVAGAANGVPKIEVTPPK